MGTFFSVCSEWVSEYGPVLMRLYIPLMFLDPSFTYLSTLLALPEFLPVGKEQNSQVCSPVGFCQHKVGMKAIPA